MLTEFARLGLSRSRPNFLPALALGLALAFVLELNQLPAQTRDERPKSPPAASKPATEWKSLWNGKTLEGWKPADYHAAGKVHVRNGVIVLEKGQVMTGVVYDRRDFPKMDYEVTLEGKKISGDDFFCTTTFSVGKSHCSFVVGGWGGTTVGLSSVDFADASENETSTSKEFQDNRWYRIRIRVSYNRIESWIDDDKLVDLDTKDRNISTRIECDACKPFGIATYQTAAAVRNIRVRLLSEADKKAIAATKPDDKE